MDSSTSRANRDSVSRPTEGASAASRLSDTSQLMRVPISEIVVGFRFREDAGNVAELAESFKRFGQLQPIIINDEKLLIAGFRRLSAAKMLGWTDIDAVYRDHMTEIEQKEVELEENVRRLDMSWMDRAKAIAAINELKRKQDPSISRDVVAEIAGVGKDDVTAAIKIVKLAELFPELKDAKSLFQAQSWAQAKVASVVRLKEVRDNPTDFQAIEEKILHGDSVEVIKSLPSGFANAIITDPPFGLDYDKSKAGIEQSITAYTDDKESYIRILSMAKDIHRVLKPDGWCIWFFGPTWWWPAKRAFTEAGFLCDEIPLIWYRRGGRAFTTRPDRYFARHYDMALHLIKGDPQMTPYGRGKSNVLEFEPVEGDQRELLVERPVELYQELVKRLTFEGETVVDFFAGSGSVLAAAASLKRNYLGVEISAERRAVAIKKVLAHTPTE